MVGNYELQNPRKLVRAMLILGAVLLTTVLPFSAYASSDRSGAEFQYVTVSNGDSMWDLAKTYGEGKDPRDWIAEAVILNNLQTSELQVGQQIALP